MTEASPLRRILPAGLLLLVLAGLTLGLLTAPPSTPAEPVCGDLSAFPVLPLGIDYPAFTLVAYGRSNAVLAPGDTLCLALGWSNGAGTVEDYRLHIDVQKSSDSRIGGYTGPLAGPHGWDPFFKPVEHYAIRLNRQALPGNYNLVVTVFLGDQALRDSITIGSVWVTEVSHSSLPLEDGDVGYEGELQPPWPFTVPTPTPSEEDV